MHDMFLVDYNGIDWENSVLNEMQYGSCTWLDSKCGNKLSYTANTHKGRLILPLARRMENGGLESFSSWMAYNSAGHIQVFNNETLDNKFHIYCTGLYLEFFTVDILDAIVLDNILNNTMHVDVNIMVVPRAQTLLEILRDPVGNIYRPGSFVIGNDSNNECNSMSIMQDLNCRGWIPEAGRTLYDFYIGSGGEATAQILMDMMAQNGDAVLHVAPKWRDKFGYHRKQTTEEAIDFLFKNKLSTL